LRTAHSEADNAQNAVRKPALTCVRIGKLKARSRKMSRIRLRACTRESQGAESTADGDAGGEEDLESLPRCASRKRLAMHDSNIPPLGVPMRSARRIPRTACGRPADRRRYVTALPPERRSLSHSEGREASGGEQLLSNRSLTSESARDARSITPVCLVRIKSFTRAHPAASSSSRDSGAAAVASASVPPRARWRFAGAAIDLLGAGSARRTI